jgi:ABC-type transport system involved in multi-copper enzyme maturation permease subunit
MPIFDQGYQHWDGPLSGHAWRWLAITRHGIRVQMKNRILRLLLLFAWLPALALVVAVALWGLAEQGSASVLGFLRSILPADVLLEPRAYRTTLWTLAYAQFFKFQMFFIMLLVVVAGPGLISRDLRFNALPLYFSRPLTRLDYFLGKLGVIGALVAAVAVVPAVFAYLVGVCFCLDLSVVADTYPVLLASVAYGLVVTLSVGTLILALSSLSRRSLYVGIAWAGLWLISGSVATILTNVHRGSAQREAIEADLARWLAEHPPPAGTVMHGHYPAIQVKPGGGYTLATTGPRPEETLPAVAALAVGLSAPPGQGSPPAAALLSEGARAEEADRWYAAWSHASQEARVRGLTGQAESARHDWRPMCSYVNNLDRIGDALLDTDAAWVAIGKAVERPRAALGKMFGPPGRPAPPPNDRRLADQMVAQYPWTWSAGLLAALVGLSTWTLTRRVRSLDRLR